MIPVKWQEHNIRYLGIHLYRTKDQMIRENIHPIITYMEEKCKFCKNDLTTEAAFCDDKCDY